MRTDPVDGLLGYPLGFLAPLFESRSSGRCNSHGGASERFGSLLSLEVSRENPSI